MEGSRWRQAADLLDRDGLITKVKQALEGYKVELALENAKLSPQLLTTLLTWACRANVQSNAIRKAKPFCTEVLKLDPENTDALVCSGEEALKKEEYETALRYFRDAFEKSGRSDRDILERLRKAEKLHKQSKSKVSFGHSYQRRYET